MTRDTKDIRTSGGHVVVFYAYATGRDFNAIQSCYLEGTKIQMAGSNPVIEGFDATSDFKAKEKAIELLVVSLDGDSTDIVNRVLDLPYGEVAEIQAALDEATGKKKTAS